MSTVRCATAEDIPAILNLERDSPGVAHWSETEYLRILEGTAVERVVLVAEEQRTDQQEEVSSRSLMTSTDEQLPPSIPNVSKLETRNSKLVITGFAVARAIGSEWEIENIAVAPSARRQSLGKRLVEAILKLARERSGQSMYLEVRESNLPARALYESCGFVQMGRRSGYYQDPPEDALVYRHQLSNVASKSVEGV